MKQFDLDKWLVERYSPLTLERIKKAHFNYDDVIEILNAALRQPPLSGSLPCHHNYIQKDTYWKSCTHCGMIAPLWQ
jgi:hypothetical protein